MADNERLLRQWLQTDAALGVSEVPLPARRATQAEPPRPAPTPTAARDAVRETFTPPPAPPRPAPAPRAPALMPDATPLSKPTAKRGAAAALIPAIPTTPITTSLSREQKITALEKLRQEIEHFCQPFLNDICTRVVFGEGDPDAAILFVGEGPGAEEDRVGRPFVGRSGQLLDKMITAIKLKREQCYIANVVKLRAADWTPDGGRLQDRPPTPEEIARGIPFLHRQIEIIRPKVIVTLGAPAVKHLTGTTEGVMKIRGKWLQYRGIPLMPTYHPSFVLRSYTEENRRKVWEDLKLAHTKAGYS